MLLLAAGAITFAAVQQQAKPETTKLLGTWKVDLRPDAQAAPYFQKFEVKSVDGDRLTGTFYGSEIEAGRIKRDWREPEAIYFAFTTRDGSGPYNHSGKFVNGRLEGLTNSIGRNFLLLWRADRDK